MATIPDYLHILMRGVQGEKKAQGKLMAFVGGPKPVQVLRGELLAQIPRRQRVDLQRNDGRPPHNFCTRRDPSVTLYSIEDDVSPMNGRDLQLLEAIEKPCDRFAVFSEDNKLEWGNRLVKGHQVYVKLPGDNASAPTWSAGVVRHVGPVASLPGRNFGVEIKVSVYRSSLIMICSSLCILPIYRILVTLEKAAVTVSLGDTDISSVIKTVVSLCLWISLLLNHLTKCPTVPNTSSQRALLYQELLY